MPKYGRIINYLRRSARLAACELPHYRSYRRRTSSRYNALVRRRKGNMMFKAFAALRMNAYRARMVRARRERARRWYERRYLRYPYVQRVPVERVRILPNTPVGAPIVEDDDDEIDELPPLPPLASSSVTNPGGNYEALAEMGSRAASGFSQFYEPSVVASGRFSQRSNDVAPAPVLLPPGPQGTLSASTQSTIPRRPTAFRLISSIASSLRSRASQGLLEQSKTQRGQRQPSLIQSELGNVTFLGNSPATRLLTDR